MGRTQVRGVDAIKKKKLQKVAKQLKDARLDRRAKKLATRKRIGNLMAGRVTPPLDRFKNLHATTRKMKGWREGEFETHKRYVYPPSYACDMEEEILLTFSGKPNFP
jgi:hypothetical protein